MDDHSQGQALGVDQGVHFAPFTLLRAS
jgi:hypothetical protein